MSKLFQGLKCIIVGVNSAQRQIISRNIARESGLVIEVASSEKSLKVPSCSTQSFSDLTHILSGESGVTVEKICRYLKCAREAMPDVPVVHFNWVNDCIANKTKLAQDSYAIPIQDERMASTISTPSASIVNTKPLDTITANHDEPDIKKRKINDFFAPKQTAPSSFGTSTKDDSNVVKQPHRPYEPPPPPPDFAETAALARAIPLVLPDFDSRVFTADGSWQEVNTILCKLQPFPNALKQNEDSANTQKNVEYVGFDMDGTVITTKSGNSFAKDENDWRLLTSQVRPVIQRIVASGKRVVLLSNQAGLEKKGDEGKRAFQRKVEAVVASLGQGVSESVDFICSLQDDFYRKPRSGMWDALRIIREQQLNAVSGGGCTTISSGNESTVSASVSLELYVGDAAGRPEQGAGKDKRKKDFSDSDLKFAINCGVPFQTPEEFFMGCRLTIPPPSGVRLASLPRVTVDEWTSIVDSIVGQPQAESERYPSPEIVLLVSPPACGKSRLAVLLQERGYIRINQDTLGTIKKCLDAARAAIKSSANQKCTVEQGSAQVPSRGVVVDNTNTALAARSAWVQLANELNVKIRCVCLDVPEPVAGQLHDLRLLDPKTPLSEKRNIPRFVLSKFYKDRTEPGVDEGFDRIDRMPFRLQLDDGTAPLTRRLMHSYL